MPLKKRRATRDSLLMWVFLAPSLAIFVLYRFIPLIWNGVLSFQFWSPYQPSEFAGLYHYKELLLYDDVFWQSLRNTAILIASAPVGILIALIIAVLVDTKIRGRAVYRTIVFLSFPLMPVVAGIIWQWLFDEKVGLINYILLSLGVIEKSIPILESFELALPAVIVVSIWQILGLYMIILLAGLQNIQPSLYEAAAIDGCNSWQQFRHITLPLLRPSIFLCSIIGIISSFANFDLIFVMTNGGPGYATELLITYIYRTAFRLSQFDYAGALTIVNFIFLLLLAWLANIVFGGEAGAVNKGR